MLNAIYFQQKGGVSSYIRYLYRNFYDAYIMNEYTPIKIDIIDKNNEVLNTIYVIKDDLEKTCCHIREIYKNCENFKFFFQKNIEYAYLEYI